jgi:hypothetical protein
VKPRDAAALALVGWYLMMPPMERSWTNDMLSWLSPSMWPIKFECNYEAPISRWKQWESYESLDACKAGLDKAEEEEKTNLSNIKSFLQEPKELDDYDKESIFCAGLSRCIASDDPRLKGN